MKHKKYLYKISLLPEPLFLGKENLMADFFCIDRRKHEIGLENANNCEKVVLKCKKFHIDRRKDMEGNSQRN